MFSIAKRERLNDEWHYGHSFYMAFSQAFLSFFNKPYSLYSLCQGTALLKAVNS